MARSTGAEQLMARAPRIAQHDVTDCGAACLASIAQMHGMRIPIARLRQYAHTDKHGTSMLGLTRAAERIGFSAKSVRAKADNLHKAPLPAIAHTVQDTGLHHFVVIDKITPKGVRLMDPAGGRHVSKSHAEFTATWTGALLLLAYAPEKEHAEPSVSRMGRVWSLMRPHRGALVQALVGALVYTVLGLSTSIYVQQIVDGVLADGQAGLLRVMTVAMIAITCSQTIITALRATLMLHISQRIDAALILGYYRHVLRLPQSFFDRMRVGELTSRISDAVKIRAFIGDSLVDAAANVLVVVASSALLFSYDWRLAAWTVGLLPVYAALYLIGAKVGRRQQRTLMERGAALESQIVESLGSIGTVKRFGIEEQTSLRTEAIFVRLFRGVSDATRTSICLSGAGQFTSRIGTIGLLYIGTTRALSQQISAGQLMSCYALLGFLTGPLLSLIGFSRVVEEARVAGERLFEIMELEPEAHLHPMSLDRETARDVRFDNVSFRYGNRSAGLSDVSFTCAAGSVTALVGESGSGKSTIAALMQRLYEVERGRVLIGSRDIAHVSPSSVRRFVNVVPQTLELFAGTILENLALGNPEPDVERIVQLCDQVGLRETIERLPQGWLTLVGERGATLSGGERQRVAIVRALYRRPAVLILDEATSALDSVNEELVVEMMHRLARSGVTVVVIAHRLTTVSGADHIVVLEQGRVIEEGTHEALVQGGGVYGGMWERQHPPVRRLAAVS